MASSSLATSVRPRRTQSPIQVRRRRGPSPPPPRAPVSKRPGLLQTVLDRLSGCRRRNDVHDNQRDALVSLETSPCSTSTCSQELSLPPWLRDVHSSRSSGSGYVPNARRFNAESTAKELIGGCRELGGFVRSVDLVTPPVQSSCAGNQDSNAPVDWHASLAFAAAFASKIRAERLGYKEAKAPADRDAMMMGSDGLDATTAGGASTTCSVSSASTPPRRKQLEESKKGNVRTAISKEDESDEQDECARLRAELDKLEFLGSDHVEVRQRKQRLDELEQRLQKRCATKEAEMKATAKVALESKPPVAEKVQKSNVEAKDVPEKPKRLSWLPVAPEKKTWTIGAAKADNPLAVASDAVESSAGGDKLAAPGKGKGKGSAPPPPPKGKGKGKDKGKDAGKAGKAPDVWFSGRRLQWRELQGGSKTEDSIFDAGCGIANVEFDFDEYDELFLPTEAMVATPSGGASIKLRPESTAVCVLSQSQATNCAIILRKIGDLDNFCDLLVELRPVDEEEAERLQELLDLLDDKTMTQLEAHAQGDAAMNLRAVERQLLPLLRVNKIRSRVQLVRIGGSTPGLHSMLMGLLQTVVASCKQVRESSALKELVWTAMRLRDYVKRGPESREDTENYSRAMDIGTLLSGMREFKAVQPGARKVSLLNYFARTLLRTNPEIEQQLIDQLPGVSIAAQIPWASIRDGAGQLRADASLATKEAADSKSYGSADGSNEGFWGGLRRAVVRDSGASRLAALASETAAASKEVDKAVYDASAALGDVAKYFGIQATASANCPAGLTILVQLTDLCAGFAQTCEEIRPSAASPDAGFEKQRTAGEDDVIGNQPGIGLMSKTRGGDVDLDAAGAANRAIDKLLATGFVNE